MIAGHIFNSFSPQQPFAVHPLPRLAQIAPGYSLGVHDFDGDGRLDLFVAQNSFSPEPETGRFDGGLGLVLQGRGDCTFAVLEPLESGVVMPEDAVDVVVLDDGTTVVVSTNDGPLRAFRDLR